MQSEENSYTKYKIYEVKIHKLNKEQEDLAKKIRLLEREVNLKEGGY